MSEATANIPDEHAARSPDVPMSPPAGKTPSLASVESDDYHDADLATPELYLNRELTWLSFNWRVFHEAADPRTPLLERVKFLAIVSSNLDEFFMKRIGGLKQQVGAGLHGLTVDGRTPEQQISDAYEMVRPMQRRITDLVAELMGELNGAGIRLARYGDLSDRQRKSVRTYYYRNIFPLVTPQAVDPAHPFPFVSNLSLNLLVTLNYPDDPGTSLARVKVPVGAGIRRLLPVKGEPRMFVRLEDVMAHNLDLLFPGMEIDTCELFRVTRNAITELDEDQADDLLEMIREELRERKFAPIVRLEVAKGMSSLHRGMLAAELGLNEISDVFEIDGMLGVRDLMELVSLDLPDLKDPQHVQVDHPKLITDRSIFHTIRSEGPLLLMHPYESFSTSVERFLREAAEDPKVRAVKMTLYRTSADSEVIKQLIHAARNGKQVAVVVELKARFDEEANIQWATRLEEAGIHVTYGVVGLKTHCKVVLVVRQDYDGLRRYAHIGTGNYHAGTARTYADCGLLTSRPDIGEDLTELFNYLTTGYKPKRNYNCLLPAPKVLKPALFKKIEREIERQQSEGDGLIQMKLNALEDEDITRALYEAGRAGVRIQLIVRDTCRLRPGLPGLTESVSVVSIVGRFLEHARLYYFHNGGKEEYYLGSADCMKRNLESRVETLAPVRDPGLKRQIRFYLDTQLGDQRSAWDMQPDGSYSQRTPRDEAEQAGCHQRLAEWAGERHREATRLRRRKPRVVRRRNI